MTYNVVSRSEAPNRRRSSQFKTEIRPWRNSPAGIVVMLLTVFVPTPRTALAQEAPATTEEQASALQEVTVTATRRSESVQSVPMSISAYSAADLQRTQAVDLYDLQRQIPDLTTDGNTISIRGIGSSSNAGASTTGIYIDDTPLAIIGFGYGAQNPVPLLFDLERVEVLRGPQGTLFGAGAEGGVVRYITPQPSLTEWSGFTRMTGGHIEGGADNTEVGFAVGGPIVQDTLGIRVSAEIRNRGGWIDDLDQWNHQVTTRNYNSGDDRVFRIALTWRPTENLQVSPSFHYQSDYATPGGFASGLNVDTGVASVYWSDPSQGMFKIPSSGETYQGQRWFMPAVRVQYDFAGAQLISSTSYVDVATRSLNDGTWVLANYIPSSLWLPGVTVVGPDGFNLPPGSPNVAPTEAYIFNTKQFTQEIRLQSTGTSDFQWIVGAFFTHSANYNNTVDTDAGYEQFLIAATGYNLQQYYGEGYSCGPGFGCNLGFYSPFHLTAYDIAGFGEGTYNFTNWLKATVGVRETSAHLKFDDVSYGFIEGETDTSSGGTSVTAFTPKFNLSVHPNANNMFYGTIAKGFRDPAGNGPVSATLCASDLANLGLTKAPPTFGPDNTWDYEVGAKNTLFGGHLVLDSSAYLIKWNNIQTSVNLPCAYSFIMNSGQVTAKGFDSTAKARFGNFAADFSLGYLHGVYTQQPFSVPGTKPAASLGDHLPAPDLKVSAGLEYDLQIAKRDAFARIDYQYAQYYQGPTVGSNNSNPNDATYVAGTPLPRATKYFTARTGVTFANLEVSLFVDNLLNSSSTMQLTQNYSNKDYYTFETWRPRTVMLEAQMNFK